MVDQSRIQQSIASVKSDIKQAHTILGARTKDISWWDEAIDNLIIEQNEQWIKINFRKYLLDNYGINALLVLSDNGLPIYAERSAEKVDTLGYLGFELSQLMPMVEHTQLASIVEPESVVSFITRDGELFLVALSAITPETVYEILPERKPRPTLVFFRKFSSELSIIETTNSLLDLSVSITAPTIDSEFPYIVVPLLDFQQRPVGYVKYLIELPGKKILQQAFYWSIPIILLCVFIGWYISQWFRVTISDVENITVKAALLKDSQQHFQNMADSAPVLIWETDAQAMISYANSRFKQLVGKQPTHEEPLFITDIISDEDQKVFNTFFQTIVDRKESQGHEFKVKDVNGKEHWLAMECSLHQYNSNKGCRYIFSASDITDRKEMEKHVWQQAHYDELTGLPNRNLFHDRLNKVLEASARRGNEFVVIFIDLDNFKNINDSLGHVAGDEVLQQTSERILDCLRDSDTVARLGGDEFVLLLTTDEEKSTFEGVAQRILRVLAVSFMIGNKEVYLSASIGLAIYPSDGNDAKSLMMNADTAMYRAKQKGRNQICYYTPEMNARLQAQLQMEVDLHQALKQDEFFLLYQPIVELISNKIIGAEALVRWRRSDGTIVSPDQFIPITEQTGIIKELGNKILYDACHKLKQWNDKGLDLSISVNLSPAQFHTSETRLQDYIKSLLDECSLAPSCLTLELTESLLIDESSDIIITLETLSEMGVKLAVDDFGTGYSALSYLRKFPVNILKIDRTFVNDIPSSKEDVALVKAIIAMAHSLDLIVLAEGIETVEQNKFLIEHSCSRGQGYLYGRPQTDDDFVALVQRFNKLPNNSINKSQPIPISRGKRF